MATVGLTTVGANTLNVTRVYYQKLTAPEDMDITSIHVYADGLFGSGTTTVIAGLYDEVASVPENLLVSATAQAVTDSSPQWYTLNVTQSISSGANFWIGVQQAAGTVNRLQVYYDTGGTSGDSYISASGTTPAATMYDPANEATARTDIYSFYVTYTAGGGTNPKGPLTHPLYGPFRGPIS